MKWHSRDGFKSWFWDNSGYLYPQTWTNLPRLVQIGRRPPRLLVRWPRRSSKLAAKLPKERWAPVDISSLFVELKRGRRHLINLITAFLTNILENQVKFFHQRRLQELRQSLIFYVEVSVNLSSNQIFHLSCYSSTFFAYKLEMQLNIYCLSHPQLRNDKAKAQFSIPFFTPGPNQMQ